MPHHPKQTDFCLGDIMITSEKELENYIIDDEDFCKFIGDAFSLKHVNVIENQVHVGNENIIDVLCAGLDDEEKEVLVVVELKFRPIEAKDFAQLGRYISALIRIWNVEFPCIIKGLLVGTGISNECGQILNGQLLNDDTKVAVIKSQLQYYDATCSWWNGCVSVSGQIASCLSDFTKEKR